MDTSLLLALLAGVAIAAACGLRAFLPLLLLGLAARGGLIELRDGARWLAGAPALWALGSATVLEILADKIPVVDHVLDAIGTVVRPAAAWLAAFATLSSWPSPWAQLAALVLGGLALSVHGLKSKVRLGSSAVTLGHGNPILSVVEDLLALIGSAAAVLAPMLAALLLVGLALALRPRRRAPSA